MNLSIRRSHLLPLLLSSSLCLGISGFTAATSLAEPLSPAGPLPSASDESPVLPNPAVAPESAPDSAPTQSVIKPLPPLPDSPNARQSAPASGSSLLEILSKLPIEDILSNPQVTKFIEKNPQILRFITENPQLLELVLKNFNTLPF
ncbi:hypothetical protein [Lyngbya confervoides]|uniref:Uncharacterized protein n=1 Tax=Lyngbya confervoides BDU141951 TaxID=1574623 RepID=A0ABD4T3E4_9CYAN|nr:hypothetical protein [Lyngbya confervoides]MCM1982946.1 hypothetical protein [Lyngbya confervoides BDU141951]